MDEGNVVYIHKRTLCSHLKKKKKGNLAICYNMDGPWGHCAKKNKSEKDENHLISLICQI